MAETGDWVTPRLYGKPWFEKPVLYYWGAALSFKLFGVSDAAARLPSAFSALLATLAMAWLALRVYGAETARWLLLLLPTTVGMIGFSHAAATDMPFAAMLTIAMVFAARLLGLLPESSSPDSHTSFTSSNSFNSLALGFFLGLAVLAKGPAAIVLSGGAVLLWAIFTKRWRDAFRCLHPSPSPASASQRFPGTFSAPAAIPISSASSSSNTISSAISPPSFSTSNLFGFISQWFLSRLSLGRWSCCGDSQRDYPSRFGTGARVRRRSSCSPTLSSVSSSSRLPNPSCRATSFPQSRQSACFCQEPTSCSRINREKSLRWILNSFAILALPGAILLIALGRHFRASRTNAGSFIAIGCVVLAFAMANLLLTMKERKQAFPIAYTAVLPVLFLLVVFHFISRPWLRYDPSGKTLASEITAAQIPADQLYVASMKRGQQYSLSFYLHREIPIWDSGEPKPGFLLLPSKNCAAYTNPPLVCASDPVPLQKSGWFAYRIQ